MVQAIENPKLPKVIWEKLPDDYILPDDPVDNLAQPLLATALNDSLELYGQIAPESMIASNMGICTKVAGKIVLKAPDWFYVSKVFPVLEGTIRRSYTPHTEGEVPALVMEFLSESEGGEYSIRPTYPYGKLWFYERILQVPIYVIFEPDSGMLEVRQLTDEGYQVQSPDAEGRYSITAFGLSLGIWYGERLNLKTHWLRWWDQSGNLLLWGSEQIALERQRTEKERQRAEQAEQEIARLRGLLEDNQI